MRTGWALFLLMGLSVLPDVNMWPKSSDIKPEHYSYVQMNAQDSVKAIDNYRKMVHLNNTGFYRDFFTASDQKLTIKMYVWFLIDFITIIIITLFWLKEASAYSRVYVFVFLVFLVGNFLDFLVTYNSDWAPNITYNIITFALNAAFLFIQEYKQWKEK